MPDGITRDGALGGSPPAEVRIGGRNLIAALFAVVALFAALDLLSQAPRYFAFSFSGHQRLDRMFHLGREANVSAWFSGMLLFTSGLLLALIGAVKRQQSDPYRWHWAGLAVLFIYLSADEVAVLHEQISSMLAPYTFAALNYGGWIGYGVVAVGALTLVFLPFFLSLSRRTRILFTCSAAVFTGGAIGLEVVALPYENGRPPDFGWAMLVALEETLEMSGVIIFIGALVDYMRLSSLRLELRFGARDRSAMRVEQAAAGR
jgi:hypothetical protein